MPDGLCGQGLGRCWEAGLRQHTQVCQEAGLGTASQLPPARLVGARTPCPERLVCVCACVCVCMRAVTADSLAVHPQQAGRVLCLGAEVDTGASPLSALPLLHWILPSFRRTAVYLLKALHL